MRKPFVTADERPSDYAHAYKRGTVQFLEDARNYCFHTVEIPPGSVVRGRNFSQIEPGTQGIICDGELTLIECNLVNNALDPRWTVQGCNTSQHWRVDRPEKREFVCSHPSELKGDEKAPADAITVGPDAITPLEVVR